MKKLFNIFTIFFIIHITGIASLTLQSSKLCSKIGQRIISDECMGYLKYKCDDDYCSLDKETCDKFSKVRAITRSIPRILNYYEKKTAGYKQFIKTIKKCPMSEEFNLNELSKNVCLREKNCIVEDKIYRKKMRQSLAIPCLCPCIKKQSIDCDPMVCVTSQKDCLAYKFMKKQNQTVTYSSCQNGNKKFLIEY